MLTIVLGDAKRRLTVLVLSSFENEENTEDEMTATVYPPSGILLTPIESGEDSENENCEKVPKTLVQVVVFVDAHIDYIPEWLVNAAVDQLAFLILKQIRVSVKMVENSEKYQSIFTDPGNGFYNYLRKRFAEDMEDEVEWIPRVRELD